MTIDNPSGAWSVLQDKYYRKQEIYSMLWTSMDLSKLIVTAAPNGGPIATVRNDRKMLALASSSMLRPTLSLYSAAGRLLSQIQV